MPGKKGASHRPVKNRKTANPAPLHSALARRRRGPGSRVRLLLDRRGADRRRSPRNHRRREEPSGVRLC